MLLLLIMGCSKEEVVIQQKRKKTISRDTLKVLQVQRQSSADMVDYQVYMIDSTISSIVETVHSPYDSFPGIATFRGTPFRDMPLTGILDSIPKEFHVDWIFKTSGGKFGEGVNGKGRGWGGGAGWTGQPSLRFDTMTGKTSIYQGSLAGKVFRIDYDSGKELDSALDIHNPIKGSIALDPLFQNILYVGQGIRYQAQSGARAFDLSSGKQVAFQTADDKHAKRRWGFFDSSPIAWHDFLIWPAENGILYKFKRTPQGFQPHSKFVYSVTDNPHLGLEASIAIYGNYGIIADNGGSIICIDLQTLQPKWYSANGDDTDATPVIAIEGGIPYVYTGSEVDKQGKNGNAVFRKLSVLTGEEIWKYSIACHSISIGKHILNGGMLGTPLLGRDACNHLIYTSFVQHKPGNSGVLMAFDRQSGTIAWQTELDAYSWSSPIGYIIKGGGYIVVIGDVIGNMYAIDGNTGKILFKQRIGTNFEASPIPWRNTAIIGSRGTNIYRISLR
jgi:outer membrane protein assembly factor BamB